MRTTVLITSRGNPEGLTATCMALIMLAKHRDELTIAVRADDDDQQTIDTGHALQKYGNVVVHVGPRPRSLGETQNLMARANPADVYCILNDSVYVAPVMIEEPHSVPRMSYWDVLLSEVIEQYGDDRLYCWNTAGVTSYDYPIFTAKWYAAAGYIFPERFAFWFDDMTVGVINMMVHGQTPRPILGMLLYAPKNGVQRFRDIEFWAALYRELKPWREQEAVRLRRAFGMPTTLEGAYLEVIRIYEEQFMESLKVKALALTDKRPPDPGYLALQHSTLEQYPHLEQYLKR